MNDSACYVAAVLNWYVDLPDTPLRATVSDQWLARRLHAESVPLSLVETALLLASLRRIVRPQDAPPLPPVRSLAYFQPVVEELRAHPVPDGYLDYLRLKLRRAALTGPADVQNTAFPDDC